MLQFLTRFRWVGVAIATGLVMILVAFGVTSPTLAQDDANTELLWYGQSAYKITTPSGNVLLVDPWITNPLNPNGEEDLANLGSVDLVLVTHGHGDHVGDLMAIAEATEAQLISSADLGRSLVAGGFPEDRYGPNNRGNFGGEISLMDDEVKVAFIPAVHSSAYGRDGNPAAYAGNPGGFLISIENGPVIYHTGDTDVFADMALIPQFGEVDVMLTCIGDQYTMGPDRAAEAVKLVNPKMAIPNHYGVFTLTGTPEEFEAALTALNVETELKVMEPGESIML
ncbi:MAG: metal-dependent hydrolase [Leptolyngbyaceae bacterium]|nr:metal-dependent hydrolase [Leptolyngbyaceae bacterium]